MGNSYKAKFFQKDLAVTSIKELKDIGVDMTMLNSCVVAEILASKSASIEELRGIGVGFSKFHSGAISEFLEIEGVTFRELAEAGVDFSKMHRIAPQILKLKKVSPTELVSAGMDFSKLDSDDIVIIVVYKRASVQTLRDIGVKFSILNARDILDILRSKEASTEELKEVGVGFSKFNYAEISTLLKRKGASIEELKELGVNFSELGVDFSSFHNELNKCGNIKFWEDTCVNFFGKIRLHSKQGVREFYKVIHPDHNSEESDLAHKLFISAYGKKDIPAEFKISSRDIGDGELSENMYSFFLDNGCKNIDGTVECEF